MPKRIEFLEKDIERSVVRYCQRNGYYCRKLSTPGCRGVPDRLIAKNGRALFLELKRPGEKPTHLQEFEMNALREAGMTADWADNLDSAIAIIEDHFAGSEIKEDVVG